MAPVLSSTEFAQLIDHTLLKADATAADIEILCREARQHQFHGVCVNGSRIELASSLLADSGIKVVCVVGFPLGAMDADVKRFETEAAVDNGAQEIDVVLNLGKLKENDSAFLLRELRDIVEAADGRPVKVILETGLLTREGKILACQIAVESGAAFVKTSTGFSGAGATAEDVRLMREAVGSKIGVKASGGIRSLKTALSLIEAGANRLGVSASVEVARELRAAAG